MEDDVGRKFMPRQDVGDRRHLGRTVVQGPVRAGEVRSILVCPGCRVEGQPAMRVRVIDVIRGFLLGWRSQCDADARVAQRRECRRRCLPRRQSIPTRICTAIQRQMRWVRKANHSRALPFQRALEVRRPGV